MPNGNWAFAFLGPIFVIRSYGSWGTRMEDHNTMLLDEGCGNVFL